jgi:hypothetical protein
MNKLIEEHYDEFVEACRRRHVKKIELFGSAVTDQFDPERSDLDFIVTFKETPFGGLVDDYFGLIDDLEKIFGRSIDLVMERAMKNPYFIAGAEKTRTVVYAA